MPSRNLSKRGSSCHSLILPEGVRIKGRIIQCVYGLVVATILGCGGSASAPSTQTIIFTAPATPVTYGVAPITLVATGGNSGSAIVFSIVSGPGIITGNMLTIKGAGTVEIAANQSGNANYTAASQVTQPIVINASATLTVDSGATGNKAVYATPTNIVGSSAYVDAAAFQSGNDICTTINAALQVLPLTGGVVDARGVQTTPTPGHSLVCNANETPWLQSNGTGGYKFTTTPADILLPRATICLLTPWIIPDQTRVIGVGVFGSNGTVISGGCSGGFLDNENPTNPSMIYMGYSGIPSGTPTYPSPPCPTSNTCTGVAVENLLLDGEFMTTQVNGIVNSNSGDLSYVNQVGFPYIGLTALLASAPGAAKYTNLTASTNNAAGPGSVCVSLAQTNGVSGVHGMTCTGTSPQSTGLASNAQSNSIEDIHLETLPDGILLGATGNSQGNVVINVEGAVHMTNVVHLSNAYTTSGVADVALLAIASGCSGCGGLHPNTIQDDVTSTTLTNPLSAPNYTDQSVGLYVLGESVNASSSEYSRFSTSPRIQTWAVGSTAPVNATPNCAPGSLYSNTGATYGFGSPNTIYVCYLVSGIPTWTPLI